MPCSGSLVAFSFNRPVSKGAGQRTLSRLSSATIPHQRGNSFASMSDFIVMSANHQSPRNARRRTILLLFSIRRLVTRVDRLLVCIDLIWRANFGCQACKTDDADAHGATIDVPNHSSKCDQSGCDQSDPPNNPGTSFPGNLGRTICASCHLHCFRCQSHSEILPASRRKSQASWRASSGGKSIFPGRHGMHCHGTRTPATHARTRSPNLRFEGCCTNGAKGSCRQRTSWARQRDINLLRTPSGIRQCSPDVIRFQIWIIG